ncbi:MAG: DUF819 family protein [Bacteroidia bacterium]
MNTAITLMVVLLLPILFIWGEKKSKIVAIIGPVLLCYGMGLLLGNIGLKWPKHFIEENVSVVAVPLAIPLLMFGSNPKTWRKLAPVALLSFAAGAVSVILAIIAANIIWQGEIDEISKISAMLVGVYTGGTPNLTAIGTALDVSKEMIPTLSVIDTVLCAIYLLVLLSIAEKALNFFLKPGVRIDTVAHQNIRKSSQSIQVQGLIAVLLSATCLALGIGISMIIKGQLDTVIILLSLTVLAFALSFSEKINNLKPSYKIGEYLILVFCLAIGLISDFSVLVNTSGSLLAFCAFVVYASILLHILFAKLLKIDTHHLMITSTAALFGPAFVGMVASKLKNPTLVVSGMTTGVIGYVIANILGLTLFKILEIL